MKALVVLLVAACAAAPTKPHETTPDHPAPSNKAQQADVVVEKHVHPPIVLVMLGLEADAGSAGVIDADTVAVAKDLTLYLRNAAREDQHTQLVGGERELTDEKLLLNCGTQMPSCMAPIGGGLGADYMLFGNVERQGGQFPVSLTLLDVHSRLEHQFGGVVTNDRASLESFATGAYHALVDQIVAR